MTSKSTESELHVQLLFMLGKLVDLDYLHLIAIWSKGKFWRWLFLEPRACTNHTNQNNSVIFKVPIFKNIH